ncbi:MAG TPA: alcohol dehydrogenase catalytic domain-containing protein, partial [Cellulomonas sp.]
MKVARLHGVGDVRIAEEPRPDPGEDEALVRVTAVGLCGSDLHWFAQGGIGDAVLSRPLVLGHEFGGVVQGGPLDGVRVAVDPAIPCGRCESCLEGNRNLCPSVRFAGHSLTDGGLREYVAWPRHLLHPVPDSVSDAGVAVLEPLGVAVHAVDLAHVRSGATVVVVGCGPIGLAAVQVARAAGATSVVAVEPLGHRRAAASAWADLCLDPASPDLRDELAAGTGGRGADAVIECAGDD